MIRSSKIWFSAAVLSTVILAPSLKAEVGPQTQVQVEEASVFKLSKLSELFSQKFGKKIFFGEFIGERSFHLLSGVDSIDYPEFLKLLSLDNLTAISNERSIQIVPLKSARSAIIPVITPENSGIDYPDYQYITGMITLKKACAVKLLPVLRPMIPQQAHMAAYGPSNTITVTDFYGNFKRIKKVLNYMDQNSVDGKGCKWEFSPQKKNK